MMNEFGGHGWGMGFGMGWWWIIGIIILVGVIWLVFKVVNQNSKVSLPDNKTPLNILKARYASGEISKEEYEEKMRGIS